MTFRKAEYIAEFAAKVQSGAFDPEAIAGMTDAEAISALSALRGIGVWTAEMILLFCLQRRFSPYGSVANLYLWAVAGGALPELKDPRPMKKTKKESRRSAARGADNGIDSNL